MLDSCKVSVLVTFYNQAACVDRALGSVMEQDAGFPFEVLVGDDGSSDDTWRKVQEWVGRYPEAIRSFQMSRDDGVNDSIERASRNRLFLTRRARGRYVVYLDGDDYFPSKSKLSFQMGLLDAHPECGSCAHNFEYVDERGDRLSLSYPETDFVAKIPFEKLWSSVYLHASCFMFRTPVRETVNKVDEKNYDDNSIVYLLAQGKDVLYTGRVMFAYVQQEGSTWNSMGVVSRILVNQRDFVFEKTFAPEKLLASETRHSVEFFTLAFLPKGKLKESAPDVDRLGLLEDADFRQIWSAFVSGGILKNLSARLKMLCHFLPLILRKMVLRSRFFASGRISFRKGYEIL